jgi:hypothetical protein
VPQRNRRSRFAARTRVKDNHSQRECLQISARHLRCRDANAGFALARQDTVLAAISDLLLTPCRIDIIYLEADIASAIVDRGAPTIQILAQRGLC